MVLPQALLAAGRIIIPSAQKIAEFASGLEDIAQAYGIVTQAAQQFYSTVVTSNVQLQAIVRQSATVLAAQSKFFDAQGNEVDDVVKKFDFLSGRLKSIQREIELETREIVGATDETTNAVLEQVISNFGKLRGQSKKFADELDGVKDLTVNLTSALKTFGIPDFQIPQEIRSLLEGDVNNPDSRLAQQLGSLGLSKEAVEQAKAAGTYYDVLIEKTKAFADFNVVGSKTIENSFSVIKDTLSQFYREIGEDPTEGLQNGLASVVAIISDSGFIETISTFAKELGKPIGEAIEGGFLRASTAFQTLVDDIGGSDVSSKAEAIGKIIGDTIGLVIDGTTYVGLFIARLVEFGANLANTLQIVTDIFTLDYFKKEVVIEAKADTSKAQSALDVLKTVTISDVILPNEFYSKMNDLLGAIKPKQIVELDTINPERYQEFHDKAQKDLNSKGAIRLLMELAGDITPIGLAYNLSMIPKRVGAAMDAAKTVENIGDEIQQRLDTISDLQLDAPKIAEVDVSDLLNFDSDISNSIQEEISRLVATIDYSQLSEEGKAKVTEELNKVSNAGEVKNAANNIAKIVTANVSNIDVTAFNSKLGLIQETLRAALEQREQMVKEATANDTLDEVAPIIERLDSQVLAYRVQIDNLIASTDRGVQNQRALIKELIATGQPTTEATNKLKELELAAIEANRVTSEAIDAPDKGSTLLTVFNNLTSAADAFATTLGDSPEKIESDYEGLMKAIEQANQLGTSGAEELKNILLTVSQNEKITVEQRIQALEKLKAIIAEETAAQSALLNVNQKLVDLAVQRGEISGETAAVRTLSIDIHQKDLLIEEKTATLIAEKLSLEGGLKQEYTEKLSIIESELAANQQQLKTSVERGEISKEEYGNNLKDLNVTSDKQKVALDQMVIQKDIGSLATQKLRADLESLQVERSILVAKATELQLVQQLAAAEESRQRNRDRLNQATAESKAKVTVDYVEGDIDQFGKAKEETQQAYKDLLTETKFIEDELATKREAYSKAEGATLEFKNGLLNEITQLQLRATENIGKEAELRKESSEAETVELRDRATLLSQLATQEEEAKGRLALAEGNVKAAIQENLNYQKELQNVVNQTTMDLNSIKVSKIDFDVSLIEEAIGLQKSLEGDLTSKQRAWTQERLDIIRKATGEEIASLEDIDRLLQRKAELEKQNNNFIYQQKVDQAQLEQLVALEKLNLLDEEIKREQTLLKLRNDALNSEKLSIESMKEINGFLTAEQQSRLNIINNDLEANKETAKAFTEQQTGLITRRELTTEIYNNTVNTASAEVEFKNNVIDTNRELSASERQKPPGATNSGGNGGKTTNYVEGSDSIRPLNETKNSGGSWQEKIDTTSQYIRKQIFKIGLGGRRIERTYGELIKNPAYNKADADALKAEKEANKKTTSYAKVEPNTYTSFIETNKGYDPRSLGNQFKDLLLTKQKEIFGEDKYYGGKLLSNNNKDFSLSAKSDYENYKSLLISKDISSSDVLIKQFGLNNKIVDIQANILAETIKGSSGNKELLESLKVELQNNQGELKSISSYAVLSYRLQNQSKSLQELGIQRQTKATVSEINQIATDLIDFYGSKAFNGEILALGQQLESLRKDPNTTTEQILSLAQKIKDATEKTADNTKLEDLKYTSVLDALKQGGFFGGEYVEGRGGIVKDGSSLTYSGFNFENLNEKQKNGNSNSKNLRKYYINEKGETVERDKDHVAHERQRYFRDKEGRLTEGTFIDEKGVKQQSLFPEGTVFQNPVQNEGLEYIKDIDLTVPELTKEETEVIATQGLPPKEYWENLIKELIPQPIPPTPPVPVPVPEPPPAPVEEEKPKGTGLVSGQISYSGGVVPVALQPRNTTVNHYYPNQSGSVSTYLRTNGF